MSGISFEVHFKHFARHFMLSMFLLTTAIAVFAQQNIRGVVRNASGAQPLENVSIQVKGTQRGTTTDANGNFSIQANENETLVFTSVGYQQTEVRIRKQESININLPEASNELEGVVVTALGITRKEKALGYAVSDIKGEALTEAMSNNWTNALSGKVAGLNMLKSGGGPAGSNKIILRGENSLSGGGEALIVVDGVIISGSSGRQTGTGSGSYLAADSPTDFGTSVNDINPEDIESVTVLKGPGASALYGARGANGAIIITTKSGKPIKKGLGITINSNATFETVSRWPEFQYEYGQGASGQDTWYSYNATVDGPSTRSTSSAWGPRFDGQKYFQYDPVTRTTGTERTEWVPYPNNRKDFFETAKTFTNSVTVEGGNAMTSARLSVTNLNNNWIVPNTGYKRNTVALSVNQKISDKLTIASKINYTNRESDNLPSTGYNNQTIMYFIRGLTPNMNIDWFRDYWVPGQENIAQTRPFSSLLDNPFLQANEMLNKSNRNGVIGNISATYNVTKDLSIMGRASMDFSNEARSQQRPFQTQKYAEGMYRTQSIFAQEINTDFLIRYNKNFGEKFSSNFSFGGSRMHNRYVREELRADRLKYPGVFNFANSKNAVQAFPYRAEYAVNSLYGLFQFSYDNFLFLDITGRNDWSSTLATPTSLGNSSFFYPSVNLSAVLSDAFTMPAYVSLIKLRGSWSQVGSGGTNPYMTAYAYNATLFPSGLENPTVIANPDLTYLMTTSIELGADLRFFKNRLGVDIAVYQNNTKDQIANIPVDRASGYNATVLNSGTVQNKGLEIEFNGSPVKSSRGISWNIFGTYTRNINRVLELAEGIDVMVLSTGPANRGSIEAHIGGSMGDLYGLGYERAPDGQILYNSLGYPILGQTIKYLGNTMPDWKGSIGSELKYKQFGFSFLFDGQFGAVGYSLTHAVLSEEGKLKKTIPGRYNGIIGDGVVLGNDGKYYKNETIATNIQSYYNAHFNRDNVEANTFKTDFIKFREARIDYNFKATLLNKVKLQRATIGVYGRDLFMFTHWPSYDPEFGTLNNADINAGFEIGQFPSTRSIGVNLTLGL
jgi:TonB-linked SusC/RagA family outer membrane protein